MNIESLSNTNPRQMVKVEGLHGLKFGILWKLIFYS